MPTTIQPYLARIHYHGDLAPTLSTLRALHLAHLLAVPFENLDIHRGRLITPDLDAFYDKIVTRAQGGFCYELNGLFAWLLRTLGFQVDLLNARVLGADGQLGPEFDHMTLLVHLEARWLADVGFGDSFRTPLPLDDPTPQVEPFGTYRVLPAPDDWAMQALTPTGTFQDEYRFTLQPHALADYAATCRLQQTPPSHFTQKRVCSRATPDGRITLSDDRLIRTTHGTRTEEPLTSEDAWRAALHTHFNITW